MLDARPDMVPYALGESLADVPELTIPERTVRAMPARAPDPLGAPADWLRALCGVEPAGAGRVRYPLPDHEDRTPSCRVYEQPERGFFCFGCGRGGGLYDLASRMLGGPWGAALRGGAFTRAREHAQRAVRGFVVAGRDGAVPGPGG